jgi:ketosteroid isomerase-like protein
VVVLNNSLRPVALEDVEVLRSAYDALNRGDTRSALEALDENAEWHEHSSLPEAGAYRGRGAIAAFLEGFLESWQQFRQEAERFVDAGDRVAILLHSFARGKGSGVEVEMRYAHVWTMRSGRGTRVDTYEDPAEALETVGEPSTRSEA